MRPGIGQNASCTAGNFAWPSQLRGIWLFYYYTHMHSWSGRGQACEGMVSTEMLSRPVAQATMTTVTVRKQEKGMKVPQVSLTCTHTTMYLPTPCWQHLVLEPDPLIIEKEGLAHRPGWKCTLRPVCRRTSDWLLSDVHLLEMLTAREPSCILLRFRKL